MSESATSSPISPSQIPDSNHAQWTESQETGNLNQNGTNLQWTELPPTDMVPITCTEPNPTYSGQPVYMNQKFYQSNGMNFAPRNHLEAPFISDPKLNGLYLPNGARVVNGNIVNSSNVHPSGVLNGAVMNNSNGWIQSAPRLLTRPGWPANKVTGGVRKPKRIRTAFTSQQMMELEQEYARTRYLDRTRRIELAEVLHLNERTIKIWFQNRRMKEKKDKAESLEEEEATSTTDSSNELNGMPIVIHDQLPEYNRNVYIEEYPPTSASNMMPSTAVPQAVGGPIVNGYQSYTGETAEYNHYNRQVHFQMQHCPPAYNNAIQQTLQDSPPELEESQNVPISALDGNWDVSWIKSIHINEDC